MLCELHVVNGFYDEVKKHCDHTLNIVINYQTCHL